MELSISNPLVAALYHGRETSTKFNAGMKKNQRHTEFAIAGAGFDALTVYDGFDTLPPDYDALAAMGVGSPFQQRAWLESWQGSFGEKQQTQPLLAVLTDHSKPVLALPLALTFRRGVRELTWLGQDLDDYAGPAGEGAVLAGLSPVEILQILSLCAKPLGGADVVRLLKQRTHYDGVRNPFVSADSISYHASTHRTQLGRPWESYLKEKRGSRSRSRIRNKLASLAKSGNLAMQFAHCPEEAARLVSIGLDMKAVQLDQRRHPNPFRSQEARAHLITVFGQQCCSRTWVASLTLDGTPLAVAYGFRNETSWLLYQIAMQNSPLDHLSPGSHLIMFVMQHCCELGVREFDFSLGDEGYKLDWCESSEMLYCSIMPLTVRGQFAAMRMRLSAHLHNFLAGNQHVYHAARTAKLHLTRTFNRV